MTFRHELFHISLLPQMLWERGFPGMIISNFGQQCIKCVSSSSSMCTLRDMALEHVNQLQQVSRLEGKLVQGSPGGSVVGVVALQMPVDVMH